MTMDENHSVKRQQQKNQCCPFSASNGYSTMEGRDEYLDICSYDINNDDNNNSSSTTTTSLPTSSVQADLDENAPLYFWQLFSLMGKKPIQDICYDFYDNIFSDTRNENDWFRIVFEKTGSKEHHVEVQSMYWMDTMGGGYQYEGGLGRLNYHHHSGEGVRPIMNRKGAKRWMYYMTRSIRKNHYHFEQINDDRILPCLVTFLKTKMMSYAKTFQFDLDETDFNLREFYPPGKTVPQRHQQELEQLRRVKDTTRSTTNSKSTATSTTTGAKDDNNNNKKREDPNKRLIDWNAALLKRILQQIQAQRRAEGIEVTLLSTFDHNFSNSGDQSTTRPRDGISKIIHFPRFDKNNCNSEVNPNTIQLDEDVQAQLIKYVSFIASNYRNDDILPYHNFNHSSSVATFANKLLQRIVEEHLVMRVSNPPLVQFAIIFAALIQNMDHVGAGNIYNDDIIVAAYNGKSIRQQHAIDVGWSEFMNPKYDQLRQAICANQSEVTRFRNLLINTILATDMYDNELIQDRTTRWEQAFGKSTTIDDNKNNLSSANDSSNDDDGNNNKLVDLRATVVVEHILQAANIGHTMQPLHGFKRWNERLFMESYQAFVQRNNKDDPDSSVADNNDPSTSWYNNQLSFFDDYVIPLAKHLDDSGIFGSAGSDLLSCAQTNRNEWEEKGPIFIREFIRKISQR